MLTPRKRLSILVPFLFLPILITEAQEPYVVLNIGFKFGYSISDESRFVGGIEASLNYYKDFAGVGILVSTEQWSGATLDHYAVQGFWGLLGASFGPAVLRSQTATTTGYAGTLFGGAIVLPYYRYSTFQNDLTAHELGLYAKLPLPIVHPKISM